ncbi:hypothetical protein M5119_08700 [Lacticaseibacillus paracasei]|nr:hypothetical protein [Lacticaseibacillus paracasei]EKQ22729.1 hypothetical protein LCAUW4_0934 [Lacticaseibacillus casei UW4]OJF73335.1 hypothetical protein BOQ55_11835 [Lacticaseibacillus casei]ATG98416.1 hypothetical protein FAM18149p_03105 [Lacticaseibacillus paracasei]MBB1168115.1 hypothetical protein [Lacticaseibacillus paracasei]MBU6045041.1 hypothetical protein [Lacticaseibacillus paracasei]
MQTNKVVGLSFVGGWCVMFVSAVLWFAIRNGFIASILLDALGIATLGTVFFVVGYWLISHKNNH